MGYRGRNYNYNNYRNNYQGIQSGEEHCHEEQKHVHELQGSVKFAEEDDPHGHRFCTVTEEACPVGEGEHIHEVCFRTDYYDGHYHEFRGKTGVAIPVGNRHVHFIESVTTIDDGHRHEFEAATLIENPTEKSYKSDCKDHEHYHHHYHSGMNY